MKNHSHVRWSTNHKHTEFFPFFDFDFFEQVHVPDSVIQIKMITGIYITVEPPLLNDHLSSGTKLIPKVSKSNHYIWNLSLISYCNHF